MFSINPKLEGLARRWQKHDKRKFNVFRMVSDIYHRENLHSDILKILLEGHPNSPKVFCGLLKTAKPSLIINPDDYVNATIEREPGRIDVLIKSNSTGRCVILENKINGAADGIEQLSTYYDRWKFQTDAVAYLTVDGSKEPNEQTYRDDNKADVKQKLVLLAAYNDHSINLITDWLALLHLEPNVNPDFRFVIEQYIDILKELGENCMNTKLQDDFVDWLKRDPSNFTECEVLADMFNRRHEFALKCIEERYKNPNLRKQLGIERTSVFFYRGGFQLVIEVNVENSLQFIEIGDVKTSLELCSYRNPNADSPEKANHAEEIAVRYSRNIKTILTGANCRNRYNWPGEEHSLLQAIDALLAMFLQKNTA